MAERRARLHQGWSALTHAHREAPFLQGPLLPSLSSELAVSDPSQFVPLSLFPLPPNPPAIPSFAGVVKQRRQQNHDFLANGHRGSTPTHDDRTYSFQEVDPSQLHAQAVARLHTRHPWAEATVISDILQTLDLDEESASAFLVSMANDNIERVSASNEAECCSSFQGDDDGREERGRAMAAEETYFGPDAELNLSAEGGEIFSGSELVPTEPEWEEDDLYLCSRRGAFKMSRASGKHARGAYSAFMNGDYSKARALSKQAWEERTEADKLHAEAAKQILLARNGETPKDLWRLDLHGLHVNEAVSALEQRLLEIEKGLSSSRYIKDGLRPQRNTEKSKASQGPFLNKELTVITGVGNHSRGGGSLPMAVQSFLIQNRYKFKESRPGVVAVHPKFTYQRGSTLS